MSNEVQKQPREPGRPTKLTDPRVRILRECLEDNMSKEKACDFAKISKTTFYEWLRENEDFRTEMAFAEAIGIRRVTRKVEDKDPWKILKNKDPENFKDEPPIVFKFEKKEVIELPTGKQIEDKQ